MNAQACIAELRTHLVCRRIQCGYEAIERRRPELERLDPSVRDHGVVIGLLAQWVDAGFEDIEILRCALDRTPADRGSIGLNDYLHIRMAESALAMHHENPEGAIQRLRTVLALDGDSADQEAFAIANFWMGRSLRTLGLYDDALVYAERGSSLALQAGYAPMAAVIRILESWLAFQKGSLNQATRLLQEAAPPLEATDDFVSQGNIQSALGRIARRQGRYQEALSAFESAIGRYERADPRHRHLARTLVNMGFVERMIALDEQRAIERDLVRRRSDAIFAGSAVRDRRSAVEQVRRSARGHLAQAVEIYSFRHSAHGAGGAYINLGLLELDDGELESAYAHAVEAFRTAEEKHDAILMARARILQSSVQMARIEEGIGDVRESAASALAFARNAVEYAGRTQNRRLLARAWVAQGLASASGPARDLESARRCCESARRLLKAENGEYGYVWAELERLQSVLVEPAGAEASIRAWAEGAVGDKTFQQVADDFAGLLVPKVWEREGRNVARTARRLSMSPKKVRRILRSAGLAGR